MPAIRPDKELFQAEVAVDFARTVRKAHRKRHQRNDLARIVDIVQALEKLKRAMAPIRRMQGSFPYGPQTTVAETNRQVIRDASSAMRAERRKLWKMRPREDT